jgi:hypothetical protein
MRQQRLLELAPQPADVVRLQKFAVAGSETGVRRSASASPFARLRKRRCRADQLAGTVPASISA